MKAAKKLATQCACGAVSDLSCDGCGTPVCGTCCIKQISSYDPKNIVVKHYCADCSEDANKNPWGILYWRDLVSLYS